MAPSKENPAAGRADRVPGLICLAAISPENSSSPRAEQVLARKFRISAALARVIAELAGFLTGEAR